MEQFTQRNKNQTNKTVDANQLKNVTVTAFLAFSKYLTIFLIGNLVRIFSILIYL